MLALGRLFEPFGSSTMITSYIRRANIEINRLLKVVHMFMWSCQGVEIKVMTSGLARPLRRKFSFVSASNVQLTRFKF